jgi:hypothetical protein
MFLAIKSKGYNINYDEKPPKLTPNSRLKIQKKN